MNKAPYPGLRPFEWDESDIFFGREEQSDQLIDKLSDNRFLAVVGPSGCGKSSLVRAGLIADLNAGYMGTDQNDWIIAQMRPGNWPLKRLSKTFRKTLGEKTPGKGRTPVIHCVLSSLLEEIHGENSFPENTNFLLLVDQFEEIFRLSQIGNIIEANAFISLLLDLANQERYPIYVVITMRTDYIGDCAQFHGLPEAINQSLFLTPRLNREQLRDAIIGPARVFDGDVDFLLLDQLLKDVGPDPDQLPLMQHALMRTHNKIINAKTTKKNDHSEPLSNNCENDKPAFMLTFEAYKAIGGLKNALSNHANEAYDFAGEQGKKARDITQTLFQCLSNKDEGQRDIRNPVKLSHVAGVAGVTIKEVQDVVKIFRQPGFNLITSSSEQLDKDTVLDISHESLIRQWKKMCGEKEDPGWVKKEADKAEEYRLLAEAAHSWDQGRKEPLGEMSLTIALRWNFKEAPNKDWAKRYDRPLANRHDKDLARMYDTVLANRQDDALVESYKTKVDLWCAQRFDLAMKYLIESIREQISSIRLRKKKRNKKNLISALGLAAGIIAVTVLFLWISFYYFPGQANEKSLAMELRAGQLAKKGEFQDAENKYNEAMEKSPYKRASLHKGLANVYLKMGENQSSDKSSIKAHKFYNLSEKNYLTAINIDKGKVDIQAHNGLATVYLRLNDTQSAMEYFKKTIEFDSENVDALLGKASLHTLGHIESDNKEAEKIYLQVHEIIKKSPAIKVFITVCKGLGNVYIEMEKYDNALEYFKKSQAQMPEDTDTLNQLGYVHTKLGQYDQAIHHYEQSTGIDQYNLDAYYGLGFVYTQQRKFEKAIKVYEASRTISPDNPIAYNGLGTTFLRQEKFPEALDNFQKAIGKIQSDPNNSMQAALIYIGKGYALQNLGKEEEANKAFIQGCNINNKAINTFYANLGNTNMPSINCTDPGHNKNFNQE